MQTHLSHVHQEAFIQYLLSLRMQCYVFLLGSEHNGALSHRNNSSGVV